MPTPHSPAPTRALIEYDHPAGPAVGLWLRENILVNNNELGPCYKLVVKHFSVGKKPQGDVGNIRVPANLAEESGAIDALISEVVNRAQTDANNLHSGIQLYAVFAYYTKNQNYTPRFFFRVSAQEEYDPEASGGDPTETPDARGLTTQLMRHLEAMARTTTMNTGFLIQTLQQENASQRQLIHQQLEASVEMGALIQETLDNSSARRISEKEAENKQSMMGAVFEHLKLLFPVILNKLAGQKITPETDQSFNLLASLFESMSSEQQQILVTQFLNPAQASVFAEFLGTYEKRKRTLTSSDASPGLKLNLPAMFDKLSDQNNPDRPSSDPVISRQETHAKSFRDTFKMPTFKGPLRPSTK
jgi:predicted DNA-binding ribbon-helix-helix protein